MDRRKALDGLLNKLDKQISREGDLKVRDPKVQQPNPNVALGLGASLVGVASSNVFGKVSNPLVSPITNPIMSPIHRGKRKGRINRKTSGDPLQMKAQMRQARQAEILRRHNTGNDEEEEVDGDLKANLDFVDENKYKTMEWTEPDGSKTTLKFDEDGTLVGKETTKSRPDKFSRDLKKAVDRNAVALKDYEESLMSDPVQ